MATSLPVNYPLSAPYQGDDHRIQFRLTQTGGGNPPVDLTGAVGRAQVRRAKNRDSELVLEYSFVSDAADLLDGTVVLIADAAVMTAAPFGNFFYDAEVEKNGERRTILAGSFTITAEVTVEEDYVSP